MLSRLLLLPTLLFAALTTACDSSGYRRGGGGRWTHGDLTFTPQHPPSFEPLDRRFARDRLRGYCRGTVIDGSEGASFTVVSDTEARDRHHVYYCDTYRKAQEYWSIQHLGIARIEGADPESYVSLGQGFARDRRRVYADGVPFPVRDPASFEPLAGDFAHDAERGYYAKAEIPGSHGPSFESIDSRDTAYARDRAQAYYGYVDHGTLAPNGQPRRRVRTLQGAAPAALRVLGRDYATDARQVWHRHQGRRVVGADASTFSVDESYQGGSDATDKSGAWHAGQREGAPR